MTIFSLKLEATPGTDIKKAAVEAVRIASQLGVEVEFQFNGVTCIARPGGNGYKLAQEAFALMGSHLSIRFATS